LASSGVPYLLRGFSSTECGVSTAALGRAIDSGGSIEVKPVLGPPLRLHVLPLDLWSTDFPD
jgi:hypothetical protein